MNETTYCLYCGEPTDHVDFLGHRCCTECDDEANARAEAEAAEMRFNMLRKAENTGRLVEVDATDDREFHGYEVRMLDHLVAHLTYGEDEDEEAENSVFVSLDEITDVRFVNA